MAHENGKQRHLKALLGELFAILLFLGYLFLSAPHPHPPPFFLTQWNEAQLPEVAVWAIRLKREKKVKNCERLFDIKQIELSGVKKRDEKMKES